MSRDQERGEPRKRKSDQRRARRQGELDARAKRDPTPEQWTGFEKAYMDGYRSGS
jgi:hypothetical protein